MPLEGDFYKAVEHIGIFKTGRLPEIESEGAGNGVNFVCVDPVVIVGIEKIVDPDDPRSADRFEDPAGNISYLFRFFL